MKRIIKAAVIVAALAGGGMAERACGQYDRAVVALTRLDYVYYNVDNPMSVAVPGLLPKDLVVSIGEEKAYLHRDPDGSCSTDLVVRPKDSTGTIEVHVDERIDAERTRRRGLVRLRVVTLPDPVLYLGYVRDGDTVSLDDLLNKGYIQVKAQLEDINLPLEAPVVESYDINRSEWFNVPVEVSGSRLTAEAREMLGKARRDETLYIDNVKVTLPDGRRVTLKAEFPLK
ncbi:MAG: hypothetical protein IJK84_00010 [Bacteroidales bacterium]|nr:hypothetical protein [Bacteroidales bacterium]